MIQEFAALFHPIVQREWQPYLVLEHKPADPSWLNDLNNLGVNIICMPRSHAKIDMTLIRRIYALCKNLNCTVFHCDNMHTNPLIASYLAAVPVRIWYKLAMNSSFEECRRQTFYDKLALTTRLSCFLATRVIAISEAVKDELMDLGISERKIIVQSSPRRNFIKPIKDLKETMRSSLAYSGNDVVIATIGHAMPVKGWDILLKAFSGIARDEPQAKLLMIGSTNADSEKKFFSELKNFIKQHELTNSVLFPGHVLDIQKILAAADIFVLPSRSEGSANVLIEAMELGLPCIASRVGNADEIIQDSINGFLVIRNDPDALERALRSLVKDKNMRLRFAAEAKLPTSILTLEEYAERIASIYDSLLKERIR